MSNVALDSPILIFLKKLYMPIYKWASENFATKEEAGTVASISECHAAAAEITFTATAES